MPVRFTNGLRQSPQQEPQEESFLGSVGRNLSRAFGGSIASGLGQLSNIGYIGSPQQNMDIVNQLRQAFSASPEQAQESLANPQQSAFRAFVPQSPESRSLQKLKQQTFGSPQGSGEEFLDRLVEIAPTAALFGGANLGTALGSVGAAAGSQALSDLGPLGELAGGYLGGQALPAIGRMHKPSQRPSKKLLEKGLEKLPPQKEASYAKARNLAEGIRKPAPEVRKVISDISQESTLGLEPATQNRIGTLLEQLEAAMPNRELGINEAKDFVRNLNKSYGKKDPLYQERIRITKSLNDFIDRTGSEIPDHGKIWNQAKQEHIAHKKLKQQAHDLSDKWGRVKSYVLKPGNIIPDTLALLGYYFGGAKVGIPIKIAKTYASEVGRVKDLINTYPELRGELNSFIADAAKSNPHVFLGNLKNFDTKVRNLIGEEKKENKKFSNLRFT